MSDFLDKLFHTTAIKEFVPLFKEVVENYENPETFLGEVASYLPIRLYEHYYDDSLPHSFFGLISASLLYNSVDTNGDKWKPFAQQSWFATKEKKRRPLDLKSAPTKQDGDLNARWSCFQEAADSGNFEETLPWTKGFLSSETDRRFFRKKSLEYALDDTFQGSHKFLYLSQSWRLAESLRWTHVEEIICPALHFLVVAPKDYSLSEKIADFSRGALSSLLTNQGQISSTDYARTEEALLFGDKTQDALNALTTLVTMGASLDSIYEVLVVSAAQALSNARTGDWIFPMRSFHLNYMLHQWLEPDEEKKIYALAMGASVLHQASRRSQELDCNRQVDDLAQELCPVKPLEVLRAVVSRTDPYAAATAVITVLGMSDAKKDELFKTLASLAVKNDGNHYYGHDILFIHEMKDCYQRFQLKEKEKLPVAAGFFLGRTTKTYELFGTYKD